MRTHLGSQLIRPVAWVMQLPTQIRSALRKHKQKKRLARRNPNTAYPQYKFGRGTYGIPKVYSWGEGTTLQVGAYCSIADGVQIFLGGEHRTDWVSTYPFSVLWESAQGIHGHPRSKGDVIIGNDVWIGTEATILSGVNIGDGAVIGAKSVVVKDVPPYAIVAGNPARVIKIRFDNDTIARLLNVTWWEWDDARIGRALPLLLQEDTRAFLRAVENREI